MGRMKIRMRKEKWTIPFGQEMEGEKKNGIVAFNMSAGNSNGEKGEFAWALLLGLCINLHHHYSLGL